MKEFLRPTPFCDAVHPSIQTAVARELERHGRTRGLAIALFAFVRDAVLYEFGRWDVLASTTLTSGVGMCTNKANLLVAMLRASGIPAAYGLLRVNPQEYFGAVAPSFLKPLVSNRSLHVYAAAYLDDRWIRCDPSTDADVAFRTSHFCRQTQLVDWDGRQDALDFFQPQHVYEDLGLRPAIDEILAAPTKHATPDTLAAINDYLLFIRREPPFPSAEALMAAYRTYLCDPPSSPSSVDS